MTAESKYAARVIALLCIAEVLSMTGFAAYPAMLPKLHDDWGFSNAGAGFVGGSIFFGYMLAVPFLSSLTDRIDARGVFAASCCLTAAGTAGFALMASGVMSGALFQALTGAGLAGTYMPGLKVLTDRVEGPRQARYIAFYTATFGVGTSVSLLAAGMLSGTLSWRWSFALLASGPLLASLVVLLGLHAKAPHGVHHRPWFPPIGAVLLQREIRRFILGYAVHCWELFGLRSWMVVFIVFSYAMAHDAQPVLSATEAAALINLFGLAASILGNEAAGRIGRTKWIAGMMATANVMCWLAGMAASWTWWLMLAVLALYFMVVMADSAALTTGLVQASPLAQRGAAMAVYSLFGFGAGCLSPLVFGMTLDIAGGSNSSWAWILAFGTLGSGGLIWSVTARPDTK